MVSSRYRIHPRCEKRRLSDDDTELISKQVRRISQTSLFLTVHRGNEYEKDIRAFLYLAGKNTIPPIEREV